MNIWESKADDNLTLVSEVVEFLQGEYSIEGMPNLWSQEYFNWKLGDINPAGPGLLSVAISNGVVVGTVSLSKKRILIDGTEYIGGEVGDAYTSSKILRRSKPKNLSAEDFDPNSFKNKSVFGRLASDVISRAYLNGVQLIYGVPNKNAFPGWTKRLGFRVKNNHVLKAFSRPMSFFFVEKYPKFTLIIFIVDKIYELLFKLLFNRFTGEKVKFSEGFPCEIELEKLWNGVKPNVGFSIVRDAAYWKYRYAQRPDATYTFFSLAGEMGLVGTVCIRYIPNINNKNIVFITEWMCKKPVHFEILIFNISLFIKENFNNVHAITFWVEKGSYEQRISKRHLYFERAQIPIIFSTNANFELKIENLYPVIFNMGTSDAV
jgi:hypothetical protein